MDAQFIYRQGSPLEQDALQQLGILSYHQFSGILAPADWQTMDRFLHNEKMWNKLVNHARIFVCEQRIKLIGMAYLVPSGNPTDIYPANWSYIRMVAVDPNHRGRGIAKRLTQMCVEFARQSNEKIVGLHTSEKMKDAMHIYESVGFKLDKEIDPIYGMRYFQYRLDIK
jgi:ribosomal protein S18 acetylase RimI-like enzyme